MRGLTTAVLLASLTASLVTMASPAAALPHKGPALPVEADAAAPQPSATTTYTITALGTLGGICSEPYAINEAGQIIGRASTAGCGSEHAFFWESGTMHDLQIRGSTVRDINDAGRAVGYAQLLDPPGAMYAWAWTKEEGEEPLNCLGLERCSASRINNSDQVLGSGSELVDDEWEGFNMLWDGGTPTRIAQPGGCLGASVSAINDSGLMAGSILYETQRQVALYDGSWTPLGTVGNPWCVPAAITGAGHIVGSCVEYGSASTAFEWAEESGLVALESLGSTLTSAMDANDRGQIVGAITLPGEGRRAVLWQDGAVVDLNDLIPADSGWVLQLAQAINNAGQIAGHGIREDISASHFQAFLLTPSTPSGDVTAPAKVGDLQATVYGSRKTSQPDELFLLWTAPGDDGNEGTAAEYDIRYATAPITEASWGSALQVSGEPTPAAAGTAQMMSVKRLPGGVRWHFALKTADEAENWSPLSNVPSILAMEFRPDPDGYSFPNYGAIGADDPDFAIEDMDRMWQAFYGTSICKAHTPSCVPYLRYARMREVWNELRRPGNCLGFALTSARFHLGLDSQSDLQAGATTTYGLQKANARRHIAYYQSVQLIGAVYGELVLPYPDTASQVLDEIVLGLQGGAPDPPILSLCSDDSYMSCHVVNPIAVEWSDPDDTSLYVWVYDSIRPGQLGLATQLDLDTETGAWEYAGLVNDLEDPSDWWTSQPGANTLNARAVSGYLPAEVASAPEMGALDPDTLLQVQSLGGGRLLISDTDGRRLGFDGDAPINEIPGARAVPLPGGATAPIEPLYALPAGSDYGVLIDGQTVTATVPAEVVQLGPNYAAWVDGVSLAPATQERFQVAQDGTAITYTAASMQQLALGLALDGATISQQVEVRGLGVAVGQGAELAFDVVAGRARVQGGAGATDAYDLRVVVLDESGARHTFAHFGVPLAPGEVHYVEYGAWDGSGEMVVGIDRDGDGAAEENMVLQNEPGRLFLPMTVR